MATPWFMHAHGGKNTLVGVFPTPIGVYVRSHVDGGTDVYFYPLGLDFPNGCSRVMTHIGFFSNGIDDEPVIDRAIADHLNERMR